jgi:hypothetical protein
VRYTWSIKTGDVWYAGTDSNVFLSLNGLDAIMKEVEISDPNTVNDWEKGDTNTGSIETEDLGELQTGLLRSDQSGPSPGWFVEWVKVRNEEDGREWTAQVGAWSDADGRNGRFRLKFTLTDPGDFERIQKQKQEQARKAAQKDAADKAKRQADEARQQSEADDAEAQRQMDAEEKQLQRDLEKARRDAALAKKRAEIDKLRNSAGAPMGTGSTGIVRTYELFGVLNGATVPLSRVVSVSNGRAAVVPGGRVMVGDQASDGFGLGGMPGRWQTFYAGRSPAEFGLDPDKGVMGSDGARGWALDGNFLSQIFGSGWRTAIYS